MLYVLAGNGATSFWGYDINSNTWTTLASVPAGVQRGGALISVDADTLMHLEAMERQISGSILFQLILGFLCLLLSRV